MNSTTQFSGLSARTVAEIVGPEAARLLLVIDHECLQFGPHWRWPSSGQVYTAEGLDVIAVELVQRGHPAAAERLRTAVKHAVAIEARTAPVTVAPEIDEPADFAAHERQLARVEKSYLNSWEEQHG